jgi:hypothetical protein
MGKPVTWRETRCRLASGKYWSGGGQPPCLTFNRERPLAGHALGQAGFGDNPDSPLARRYRTQRKRLTMGLPSSPTKVAFSVISLQSADIV